MENIVGAHDKQTVVSENATVPTQESEKPWHTAFPKPRSEAVSITRHDVLELLRSDATFHPSFILVDLRRTDYEASQASGGGIIAGSINLPAQSLYHTIPSLYRIFNAAEIQQVIWYCGQLAFHLQYRSKIASARTYYAAGSSRGRGNRAAAWFGDYLHDLGNTTMQSLVLAEGIKGWVGEGGVFLQFVQGYEKEKW